MAQYPQGIFQSLQYLLKRVRVLALQKQPAPTMGNIPTGTTYTIVGRGIYTGQSIGTGKIQFPDPALMQGQMITLIATGVINVSSTYAPIVAGLPFTITATAGTYVFVSNGTNWYGGQLVS